MNLFDLLKEHAGMSREEAENYFRVENTATEWTLKSIRYLEPTKFRAVVALAKEYGGDYDATPGVRCIHIPKESVPNPVINDHGIHSEPSDQKLETALGHTSPSTVDISRTVKETSEGEANKGSYSREPADSVQQATKVGDAASQEYALSRSLKGKLGQLVPCLEDANGIMFDGFHRKKDFPNARTVKCEQVKTPVDRALARMTVNFCRRHYTPEEMKNDIGLLAGSGYSAQDIQDTTGIGSTTIYKHYPQELKDEKRSEAGKVGGEARAEIFATQVKQTVTTPDMVQPNIATRDTPQFVNSAQGYIATELRSCEKCGQPVHRSKMGIVAGKLVCPKCAGVTEPKAIIVQPPKLFKPKETGDYRVALMHPQKSKFELAVIQGLQAEGLPLETDREFCVQKTVPDAILKLKDHTIAIYIDNVETHEEGCERDEFLRSSLKKLYGFDVCVVRYKGDTEEERQKAKETVREFLKW